MLKAFNLLDEPWLPVRYADGRIAEWACCNCLPMPGKLLRWPKPRRLA